MTHTGEDAAAREGLSTEQYKRMKKLEAENQIMRAARENAERLAQKEQIFAKWNTEAEELGRLYKGFDLRTEVNNPDFVKLLGAGIPMRTAYETLHHDEIMSGAHGIHGQKSCKKQIDAIKAGQSRPARRRCREHHRLPGNTGYQQTERGPDQGPGQEIPGRGDDHAEQIL